MRAIVLLSLGTLCCSAAFGGPSANSFSDPTVYQHHPNSVLALGQGFDPRDITASRVPCILKSAEVRLDPGARRTEYKMFLADDDYAIDQAMSFDSKISATSLAGPSGSASFGVSQSSKYEDSRRRVLIWLFSDYGRFGLPAPVQLAEDAKTLLKDPEAFAAKCGTRFVAQETRMSWVAVSVEIDSASSLLSTELRASAQGGTGSAQPLSANAEASFRRVASISNKQKRLQIQIKASGGEGHADLNGVIEAAKASDDVISNLLSGLAKFNGTFGSKNAVPVRYSVASFKDAFAPDGVESVPWEDESEMALREIAKRYRANEDRLQFAIQFRDEPTKSPFRAGIAPDLLNEQIVAVQNEQSELKTAWSFCKSGTVQGYAFDGTGRRTEVPPCRLPRQRGALRGFDLSDKPKPSVAYSVAYGDSKGETKLLSKEAVRSILRAERAQRLATAKAWAADIGGAFAIGNSFDGSFMVGSTYYLVDDDGVEKRVSQEGNANALDIWWTSKTGEGMETGILDYLQKLQPTGSGIVFARITTRLQTFFDVPLFRVSWGAGKANTEYLFKFDE